MRNKNTSRIFLYVYIAISISTLYHSAYGFGTLDGLPNDLSGWILFKWWFLGFLCATSIDVGMGATVFAMINGYKSRFLTISLLVLATFSAYSQLIYASVFAEDMVTVTKNPSLNPFMQMLLDVRIILLPLCLPFFSLFYGFSAKESMIKDVVKTENISETEKETYDLEKVINTRNSIIHYREDENGKNICGGKSDNFSMLINEITCKNCNRIIELRRNNGQ